MKHSDIIIDPAVDVVAEENGNVRFLTPHGEIPLADPFGLVRRVALQCRDGASRDELARGCSCQAERDAMSQLVEALKSKRVLIDHLMPAPDVHAWPDERDILAEWQRHHAGVPRQVLPSVAVTGQGHLANALRAKLTAAGFPAADDETLAGCLVAVSDTGDMDDLRAANRRAVQSGQPFLPAWLDRSCVRWGPMVLPAATGCLECLWHREQAAARNAYFSPRLADTRVSVSPLLADLAAVMVSGELLRWAYGDHVTTDVGMAWYFDFLSADLSSGRVLRLPRCFVCGDA